MSQQRILAASSESSWGLYEMEKSWCYSPLEKNKVQCNLCIIRCRIADGKKGLCDTRRNKEGVLFNTIYGGLSSFSTDFIEKVPLYHFHPNERFLTIGSAGCNLKCSFCLTWNITQKPPESLSLEYLSPERLVEAALQLGCRGIAYTHSEPSLNIEFYSNVIDEGKKRGLKNVFATNGFISTEAFEQIADGIDAVALTIKGGKGFYSEYCGVSYRREHFLNIIAMIKAKGIHLEIVYVIIPGINDNDENLIEAISLAKVAGSPIIFLRFFPSYKMVDVDSPEESVLEHAVELAYTRGVDFAYMENIFEHPGKNTYCPGCRKTLIEREGYGVVKWLIKDKKCSFCGQIIQIEGKNPLSSLEVG